MDLHKIPEFLYLIQFLVLEDINENKYYTHRNDEENKVVYMVALCGDDGTLIGYYEKHEYTNKETVGLYDAKKR